MRGKTVKRIRKTIQNDTANVLIAVRNQYGSRTSEMGPRQVYQCAKKLYKAGKLNLIR